MRVVAKNTHKTGERSRISKPNNAVAAGTKIPTSSNNNNNSKYRAEYLPTFVGTYPPTVPCHAIPNAGSRMFCSYSNAQLARGRAHVELADVAGVTLLTFHCVKADIAVLRVNTEAHAEVTRV